MIENYWTNKEKDKWISRDNSLIARIESLDVYVLKNSKIKINQNRHSLKKFKEEYLGIISSVSDKGEETLDSTGPWDSYEKAKDSLIEKMRDNTPNHHYKNKK